MHDANDYPGTGVGLAIVRRIITRHGGHVWAHAEPDRGVAITFTVPDL
jgi:signal transduction histidine kinase